MVTAGFYLEYVRSVDGCPIVLRTDCGTENGTMAAMHCYFRSEAGDQFASINAHKYGSSHSNQRIENWWSFLRRSRSSWWINFFKNQVEIGNIDTSDELQMECLWFCFVHKSAQTDFPKPSNWNEALNLYRHLVNVANNGINV